jgi:predicted Zn-dependent protease
VSNACAERLPKGDAEAAKLRDMSIARLARLTSDQSAPLSVDDRSDAEATLIELYDAAGQHERAVDVANARAKLLEQAAVSAPDATMASTFDAHRTDTYLYLKQPEKAEQLLSEREKQIPDDYNPPARLARVLFEEKKLPDAEAAVDRALSKMTRGQRRIGVLSLKARILQAEGKPTAAVVQEQLDVFRELPRTQQTPELEAQLRKKLAEARTQ